MPDRLGLALALLFVGAAVADAADWPMWRCDAHRGAATKQSLPTEMGLKWVIQLPAPTPAWPSDQDKLQFDACYEPIVLGDQLIVGSMVDGSVTAYGAADGKLRWRYFTDGPVRFAPAGWQDRLFVASDDGFLHCLRTRDGSLLWKLRGGPNERNVLGNDRLISMWPARGGPVVRDGIVYFAAGIWPFMGIFIHAVDAERGEVVWTNSGSGSRYLVQQHGSPAFAGVAPQGALVATEDLLLVPGGRTVPAAYDLKTGEFRYFHPGERRFGKDAGGHAVMAGQHFFSNRGSVYKLESGEPLARGEFAAFDGQMSYGLGGGKLSAFLPKFQLNWQKDLPAGVRQVHLKAGDRFVGSDGVEQLCLLEPQGDALAPVWRGSIRGRLGSVLAGSDRLFAVNKQGWIFCFGPGEAAVELPDLPAGPLDGAFDLIRTGSVWKYLDDGSDAGNAWQAADFDDAKWQAGPSELGYGDGDEATRVRFGDDPKNKRLTTYFRHAFTVPKEAEFTSATLSAKVDDGAVFYLDGEEIARWHMPAGKVDANTRSTGVPNENAYESASLDLGLLKPGRHVLAVEVHQRSPGSSDISLDVRLAAKLAPPPTVAEASPPEESPSPAAGLLDAVGVERGYAVVLGADVPLLKDLARRSQLYVIAVEANADTVAAARRELAAAGLLGTRVAVQPGSIESVALPPYLARLFVAGQESSPEAVAAIYAALRPYGGVAVFDADQQAKVQAALQSADFPQARLTAQGDRLLLRRVGPLPGAAPWTHNNADAGNTLVAPDGLVKAPLGLLWFGGPSNQDVLPRHGHGPAPQVVGGRLFIEGPDMLRAVDVYTGELLWQKSLPGVGQYYDNTGHHPGAGAIGGNYISLPDAVYVAYGRKGLRLDPETGDTLAEFILPSDKGQEPPIWGVLLAEGDVLIAAAQPMLPLARSRAGDSSDDVEARFGEGSRFLFGLDRKSGKVLWRRKARFNFRHNAIVAGDGRVYCIDKMTDARLTYLKRRGEKVDAPFALYALDAKSGKELWKSENEVFGTWLGYSASEGLLLEAGSRYRDRGRDEVGTGMAVYRGESGELVWRNEIVYGGPPLLHQRTIFTQEAAYELLTGKPVLRADPLTGEASAWRFTRNYGCNSAIGCTNLLTFRSAAAGFFDLANDGGTGNFGGFRSSCTSNLIPADGVLNAPDYTRTCACSYQNQCSLALVHMPEVEVWTFQPTRWDGKPVQRIGVNFGAPGDRRAPNGTLWIDYPSVGGPSPNIPVEVDGKKVAYRRRHSSIAAAKELPWVHGCGAVGAETVRLTLCRTDEAAKRYTVRLFFTATDEETPQPIQARLQGKVVVDEADLRTRVDSANRGWVREIQGVEVAQTLELTLEPTSVALAGIEVVREDD